jgi:hypothetical protein
MNKTHTHIGVSFFFSKKLRSNLNIFIIKNDNDITKDGIEKIMSLTPPPEGNDIPDEISGPSKEIDPNDDVVQMSASLSDNKHQENNTLLIIRYRLVTTTRTRVLMKLG